MGNVISVIDALAEEKTGGENIEPKVMTADLAQSLYAGELRVPVNANMPRTGAMTNFMYGLVDTTDAFVNDTPEQIKILGGQYDVVMGGLKGDEERIKRGRMNMDTANRNLQFNQQQRDMLTPDAAKDTFGYALGSGVASYGTMVVGGYGGGAAARALGASAKAAGRATGAAAYGTMAAMEVGGEVQERADKYAADTGDNAFKNYEPEKALKNLAAESAYGTISVILEKYLGFGEQRKLFNLDLAKLNSPTLRATASLTKTGVKTAVSEAGTEFAQSLANMGIDLIDGTMDWEQVPDRLKQELTGWAAAAVIGGTAGVGVGIYNRSRGIRAIKEEIRGTVPDADLERTASAIFDSAAEKMADVVSVELELSSQLRNKHGSVMDSMQRAVKQAVDESGAFADIGEDVLAEYVVDTSKLFADQVLAEANIRNVPIEEVIKASDIVYENGGIRLKSQTGGGETRILADSSVNVEGKQQLLLQEAYDSDGKADINTPEFKAWFGDSKVVDEKGRPKTYWHGSLWNFDRFKQHNGDYNFSPDERFAYNYAESKAFEQGIDNDVTVYPVYIKAEKPFDSNNAEDIDFVKKITEGKKIRVFGNEKTQEEFIDEIQGYYQDTPLREGEFEKITQDDFPKWYSKYNHNIDYSQSSVAEYKVLEVNEKDGYFIAAKPPFRADMEDVESEIREKMKDVDFSKGETNISVSYETPYGTRVGDAYVMKVYKPSPEHRKKGADNWIYLESADIDGVDFTDILKENGYDGYYKVEDGIENLSVFEPNQIKSVYNQGTFDPNNDNIYYQRVEQAFSPTNRDKNTYISDLRAAERGEAGSDYNIRLGALPLIYQEIGIENKPVKTKKTIILKDTIFKHDVPMNVVENLPELYSDPIIIFQALNTSTNSNSYVAVLDAVDKSGRQMIAALSPSKKENGYHLITSFYGRNNIDNMIKKAFEERKVKYIRDKKNSLLTGHNAYLSQADSNILQKSDIVNSFMQQKPQPKGLYDASKGIIRIFETADFSTLPHEMAHYWLDNMWSYVRSGNASEKYRQRWNVIANWLNVRPEQAILTRGQQEKFARGYEQYLLNGNLPIPIIKGAFDDYDRWLKRVYGDMNRLNIRLSEDAVRFFQSMTTGVLPPPRIKPARKPRGKMTRAEKLREQLGLQEQDRQEQEAVKFVEEMEAARPLPDSVDERTVIVSNITEGEPGKSRVYSREVERNIDTLQEIADIDLEYNKIKLEEQAQRAAEYVKNNLEDARKIIDGRKAAPENILDTAIRIAYEQEMLRIGDNAEYLRALKLHSSLQTLRGQEIVAERISTKDIASPTYWINKLVAHRTYKAASKIFKGYTEAVGGDSPLDSYKKMIKEETAKITKKVLAETTREGQQRVLESELKRLRYEYGTGEQGELFQMPIEPLNARNAKMYIREALDGVFGTTVTQEEANQIIGKIGEIEKSIVNTLDETGNPSVQTWQKINEMNNLVEGLTPSPALQIFSSIIARGAMLASIKSPVLNVISNTENILTEMLIRRAVNSLEGGASFSAVDKSVEKDYLAYADDVYRASGYNVSTTEGLDAATITLGERRISTQGAGKFRAFARGVETGVFKYMMGYPDSRAKDFVFSDAAALEATTIAQNEGLSGEALSKRATELYEDATRVAPLTEEGMVIREKAMMEANVATYTNDTTFSKFALGIRETLNRATGNVRLGDQLMPFVKTPANVVALGVEYSIGAAYLIPNLTTVIRDVKAGKLSAKSRMAIKAAVRNGLGVVLAMLIAMALDPDDYTPDYDALTMSERRLALEKNAVFNSIRIGDKYISLDYFGPLAIPLTAVLSARRREETGWFGYAKGVASQLQKLPGLKEYSEAVDAVGRAVSNTPEKTIKNLNNAMIDFIRARTIPSIVNDLAKSIDTYERETSAGTYDKAQASVPGIREELPLKYTTTSRTPKETEAALSILLFGARVKTAASNRVIYEIDRLYKKNAKPTITDVTRSGKLSELSEAKQQRVRKEFAKRYYDGVYTLIRTREYRAKDDEQRAAAINKVRRQIIEQLKKEYIK